MSEIENTQKKSILADPAMQFKKICPDATEKQVTTLISLEQQYVELKKQLKEKQNLSKKISRPDWRGEAAQCPEIVQILWTAQGLARTAGQLWWNPSVDRDSRP